MKKIVIVAVFLVYSLTSISAQNDFRFGLKLSPTITWLGTDNNRINGNGVAFGGPKLGMVAENYFRENYAFTFGIGFAFNQGGVLKHDLGGDLWKNSELTSSDLHNLPDGANLRYSLQYVEIPFGLKMRTQEFGYIRYFAELPIFTLGILTQAKGSVDGTAIDTEKENIRKDVSTLALSWGIGAGIEYNVGPSTSLIGGIYYQNYFTDITKDDGTKIDENGDEVGERSKGVIRGLTLRIGVMF